MLTVQLAQAERILLAGATPAQVDAAMRDFGLLMGPFEAQVWPSLLVFLCVSTVGWVRHFKPTIRSVSHLGGAAMMRLLA